jgi:hypothetical protein
MIFVIQKLSIVNIKMPIHKISLKGIKGFRYGDTGKFYPINKFGEKAAYEKARKQGAVIHISQAKDIQVKASGRARGYQRSV